MTDKDLNTMSDQELINELEWLVKNREMTESRGTRKMVVDPKVKLSAIEVMGRVKGLAGFKGVTTDSKPNEDWVKDIKSALKGKKDTKAS